jgi:hypothetical protein
VFSVNRSRVQRVIIIVRGELPPKSSMEEDLQSYISMNTYLDSQDPWFWQKIRYLGDRVSDPDPAF